MPKIPLLRLPQLTHGSKRGLAILMKIYNEKLKYYKNKDLFNIFIRVFKDLYPKVNIESKEYHNAFSIIFTSEANEFYY